jgi:hypothetical protein
MKKWVNNTITGVLGAFILFLLGCQVSMLLSERKNYGVPSLFGKSFMTVLTDSMKNDENESESMPIGCGIIMEKIAADNVQPSDVITFYSPTLSDQYGINGIVSHRVLEVVQAPTSADGKGIFAVAPILEYSLDSGTSWSASDGKKISLEAGKAFSVRRLSSPKDSVVSHTIPSYSAANPGAFSFYTCGDNLHAQTCPSGGCSQDYRDPEVKEEYYIGKVTYHSIALGKSLQIVQSDWFIPVTVLVPLTAIAVLSAIDLVKQAKKEKKEEEEKIQAAIVRAGIDPKDEKAVLLFTEKERYRLEMREELEKTKAEEKKRLEKEMKSQKKETGENAKEDRS